MMKFEDLAAGELSRSGSPRKFPSFNLAGRPLPNTNCFFHNCAPAISTVAHFAIPIKCNCCICLLKYIILDFYNATSLLIVSSMTVQISIKPFYGENGSMFGVGEVMVMLVIRTHLAGDTSPGAE